MDLIWWLPAGVLVFGSLILLARIGVVQREIAATAVATEQLSALAEGGAVLTAAVATTEARRSRTIGELSRRSGGPADRGPSRGDR